MSNRTTDLTSGADLLKGICGLLALIVTVHLVITYRHRIFGLWVKMRKSLSGTTMGAPRYKAKVEITMDVPYAGESVCKTMTSNLSPGGMFVKITPPLAMKERFRFHLTLPGVPQITGLAEVLWIQDGWSEHHPSGCGCRFLDLTDQERNQIRLWIQKNKPPRAT